MSYQSGVNARRTLLAAALGATALTGLSACAPLLVGGAIVGGGLLYADRRTSGAQLEDEAIELKALKRLGEQFGDRAHINVTSYNRVVLLTGETTTAAEKATAEQIVRQIDNVRTLVNEIGEMPVSSFGSRSADSLLSGRVKASYLDAKDLMANAVKVLTERRTVFLMGIVTEREAARAADIASRVGGVQRVVRVFDVISEAELAGLQAKPAQK